MIENEKNDMKKENKMKEEKECSIQDMRILDEKGYDIKEFLCRCPNKTGSDNSTLG